MDVNGQPHIASLIFMITAVYFLEKTVALIVLLGRMPWRSNVAFTGGHNFEVNATWHMGRKENAAVARQLARRGDVISRGSKSHFP